jgi:hypothetical protein
MDKYVYPFPIGIHNNNLHADTLPVLDKFNLIFDNCKIISVY